MYQPELTIPIVEFDQGLELKQVKTEPEGPVDDETDCKDYLFLDERCRIKNEEVEISDIKCKGDAQDLQGKLYNGEYNLEKVKFEKNSNENVAATITNTKNIRNVNQTEILNILGKEKDEFLKGANDITFVEVKGYSAHDAAIHSQNISHEPSEKACTKWIDEREPKKLTFETGNEPSAAPRKGLKCSLCSYIAIRPSVLKNHFSQTHSEVRGFQCSYCEYAAKTKRILNRHILTKHEDKSGTARTRHICHMCEKVFFSSIALKTHIDGIHLNIKEKCPECDYEAKNSYVLKKHTIQVHHPENLYRCHDCGYTTPYKKCLRRHILGKHLNYYSYKCDICGDFKSKSSSHLRLHKYKHENPLKTFKCEYCPFTSEYNSGLNIHVRDEHLRGSFLTCDLCEFQTEFVDLLNNHINVEHCKIDFVCPECGTYSSKYRRDVMTHMLKVHGIQKIENETPLVPRKLVNCSLCSFTAKALTHVKRHFKLVHLDVRCFPCPHCDYAAKANGALTTHILSKHEDKTGQVRSRKVCHICKKEFATKCTLKRHIANVHVNVKGQCLDIT